MSYQPAPPANLNFAHLSQIHPDPSVPPSGSSVEPASQPQAQPQSQSQYQPRVPSSASDPAYESFTPPLPSNTPFPRHSIVIEFCDRCRWVHRATWTQTELLATFGEKKGDEEEDNNKMGGEVRGGREDAGGEERGGKIKSVTIMPMISEETGGRFRVWVYDGRGHTRCVYDRKVKGGFPELKHLKQLIRDVISPGQSLGHSDHQVTTTTTSNHKKKEDEEESTRKKDVGLATEARAADPNHNDEPNPTPLLNVQGKEPPVSGTGNEPTTGTATTD